MQNVRRDGVRGEKRALMTRHNRKARCKHHSKQSASSTAHLQQLPRQVWGWLAGAPGVGLLGARAMVGPSE